LRRGLSNGLLGGNRKGGAREQGGQEAERDHIRIIADINPQVPDRNRQPDAAEKTLGQMAMRLRDAGAQILCMPCNTAHAQAAGIKKVGQPFIDMIAETTAAAKATGAAWAPSSTAGTRPR
jgi:aspartate racemase